MFVAVLFIPVVAGEIILESDFRRLPKITERKSPPVKNYMIFDPCNLNKAGKREVSCAQLRRQGVNFSSQHYITPHNKFFVQCDMETDGGGWTVIQRRSYAEDEGTEFEKSKEEYAEGFYHSGTLSYWIGNENIYALTTRPNNKQVLKIELTTDKEEKIIVDYSTFEVGSKKEDYKLTVGGYSSPNGSYYDALSHHNGGEFMVAKGELDEDLCARSAISGGWWFPIHGCYQSNLNGRKFRRPPQRNTKGYYITWYKKNDDRSFKTIYSSVEMKIRDADYKFCAGEMAK